MRKLKAKLSENKGVDNSIEMVTLSIIIVAIVLFVIELFGFLYTEYKLHVFSTELVRTAELVGEVGTETDRREKELKDSLGIKPTVVWDKVGKFDLNEPIFLELKLDYKLKAPFISTKFKLTKKATGVSEVYRK